MKAYRFSDWKQAGKLVEVPVPEPGPGEALIRIGGAGACHSDLHIMYEWTPESFPELAAWKLPITLGHENAGWIEGGDPGGLELGTPVVISPTWSCGRCSACWVGDTNYCDQTDVLAGGLGRDGGLAEYMVAPSRCLIPLRDLDVAEAAPLSDAGLTSYHAVKSCLPVRPPGSTAVVIGVGGLGHLAVAFLRELSGARIIAVDQNEAALETARSLGADLCLPSDETTAPRIQRETGGLGAMAVLDFVGIDATLAMAAQSARKRGRIAIVGMGGGVLGVRFGALPFGCSVITTMGGSTAELAEVVALAEAGRVRPQVERFPLPDVGQVYAKLEANEISGRAVLVP